MEKRFILAITLIFIILFLSPLLFGRKKPSPTPVPPPREKQEVVQKEEPIAEPLEQKIIPQVPEETIIPVQTPLYEVQLTTEGARAISWKLKDYRERTKESGKEPEYVNLIPLTAKKCLAMQFHDPELQDEMANARWTPSVKSLIVEDAESSIEYNYTTSKGVAISKKMTFFRDSYVVDVDISFHNQSSEKAQLGGYDFSWGDGIAKDELLSDEEVANEGPIALIKTEKGPRLMKHWHRTGFACFGGKYTRVPEQGGPISWAGFATKYFAAVLIPGPEPWWSEPEVEKKRYSVVTGVEDAVLPPRDVWKKWGGSTTVALVWPEFSVAAGETVLHKFRVYAGPEKWDILRGIKGRDGSTERLGLGKMINFGTFSPLGKATLWLLKVFYHVGNNYGVAIIFLTIFIKVLYLWPTQKSFASMKKMQELQPKLTTLRDRHKDDPQLLQKETWKLYKRHGVSPLGGCIPLLLQLPVFWALFTTLRGTVELRGAMFIPGWVPDLSLPDTVATIARFPIRILPLLMTGSMLAQQLLFGTGSTGQSNKMMAMMPVFFMFIFYGMPSGLVLYWLLSNILSIGHQYMVGKQQSAKIKQEENEGKKTRKTRTKV